MKTRYNLFCTIHKIKVYTIKLTWRIFCRQTDVLKKKKNSVDSTFNALKHT